MTQNNGSAPVNQEAQFWQLKYFELLMHSTQIIAALGRPMLVGVQQLQMDAMAAATAAQTGAPQ